MTQWLALLLAIFKAVPAFERMFQELVSHYWNHKVEEMKSENKEAIESSKRERDQRFIETIIFRSPRAGKPSGHAGTVVVDYLPNVVQDANATGN